MIIQTKDIIGGAVKDVDSKNRVVTGYLSTFGVKDKHGDIIEKGAFSKSLMERKESIFFLNQHNWQQPHGKFAVIQEDEKGLYFESNPLIDTSYSMDVIKLYEAGIMREHSIGFSTVKQEYDRKTETNYLKELKLYEGSNVTIGANSDTPFTGFKTSMAEIKDQTKRILKALREGTFTDETFTLLEIALKQLQQDSYELGKISLQEPDKSTSNVEPEEATKAIYEFLKTKRQ